MRSESLTKLLPALFKAQGELEHAKKTSDNPHFKSKYADLATVLDTAKPALQNHELLVTHAREVVEMQEYLVTTLFHTSGEFIQSRTLLQPVKRDPQGYGSAITYARRYDLSALLGLAQDDDDGNGASQPKTETAAARNKRYNALLAEIDAAYDTTSLMHIWQSNQPAIMGFKAEEEMFYENLVRVKDRKKKEIAEKELEEAGYSQGFNATTNK
jgi:hypothetical protein